jgi:Smg protein
MNENVLDVLLFLFENYWEEELSGPTSRAALQVELEAAGFPPREIDRAFEWLADLGARQTLDAPTRGAVRVYTDLEQARLPANCRGFLLYLEQLGILNPEAREVIIERVLALEVAEELDLEDLKWITLVVLFSQPDQENAFAWVEDMLYNPGMGLAH